APDAPGRIVLPGIVPTLLQNFATRTERLTLSIRRQVVPCPLIRITLAVRTLLRYLFVEVRKSRTFVTLQEEGCDRVRLRDLPFRTGAGPGDIVRQSQSSRSSHSGHGSSYDF